MITPIFGSSRATLNACESSNKVVGRNAFRTSGRLMVIFATPPPVSRNTVSYQMSEYSLPGSGPDRCHSVTRNLLSPGSNLNDRGETLPARGTAVRRRGRETADRTPGAGPGRHRPGHLAAGRRAARGAAAAAPRRLRPERGHRR